MWILYALLNAFFESLKDVFSKKSLVFVDEYTISWSTRFLTVIFLLPILLATPIPTLNNQFFIALAVSGSINLFAVFLYLKALKVADLSLTVPLLMFSPLFLLITSPLILGEYPNIIGITGILLIVIGSYVLNIKRRNEGLSAPFKALLSNKGARYMFIVALLWSISSNFDKIGVVHSSPIFWVVSVNAFIASIVTFQVLKTPKKLIKSISGNFNIIFVISIFFSLSQIFQMTALQNGLVAYVIPIKRLSSLFGVLFGYLIFKEKGIKEKFLGALIMIIGTILISFSG